VRMTGALRCVSQQERLADPTPETRRPHKTDSDKYSRLVEWLVEGGARFPKLLLEEYSLGHRGIHVAAGTRIQEGEEVLEIPLRFLITAKAAMDSAIGVEIANSSFKPVSCYPFIACFILQEKLFNYETSFWRPWLDVIPSMEECAVTLPVCFSEEDLEFLKGTEAYRLAVQRRKRNLKEFEELCEAVEAVRKHFSYEQYVWARCITTTRSYGVLIGDTFTSVIVPFGDMFNHTCERETRWSFDNSSQTFVISALKDFESLDPVHVYYGNKNNGRFMAHYGFCIPDNEKISISLHDEVVLHLASNVSFNSLLIPLRSRALCRNKVLKQKILAHRRSFEDREDALKGNRRSFLSRRLVLKGTSKNPYFSEEAEGCRCQSSFPQLCKNCTSENLAELAVGLNILNEAEALVMLRSICDEQLAMYATTMDQDMEMFQAFQEDSAVNPRLELIKRCVLTRINEKKIFHDIIRFVGTVLPLFSVAAAQSDWTVVVERLPRSYQVYVSEILTNLLIREESICS